MGFSEASGERLEAVWRRFGSSLGAFGGFSGIVFRSKSDRREGAKCSSTRGNARSVSLKTESEKKAVDNAVDSAHSVCRRVRFTVSRFRSRGRQKWPQASRILEKSAGARVRATGVAFLCIGARDAGPRVILAACGGLGFPGGTWGAPTGTRRVRISEKMSYTARAS